MTKSQIYDILYEVAVNRLNYYNPCKWDGGTCDRDRLFNRIQGCCIKCSFVGLDGCEIQCLGCKLWLCPFVASKHPELVAILDTLKSVAYACGIDAALTRMTKGEILQASEDRGGD